MFNSPDEAVLDLISSYPVLQSMADDLTRAFQKISASFNAHGTLFVAGNGGSAADAEHIAGELLKGFLSPRPLPPALKRALSAAAADCGTYLADHLQQGLPCVALTGHPALTSAVGNDMGGDLSFAQQLNALARPGDVFLGLSTSGNARNVLLAAHVARVKNVTVISLTGEHGGALGGVADISLKVPGTVTHKIQELHLPVYHTLCAMLEVAFFPD
ncbi:MAG: SIS domain-containing protein [Lentisphaeria bacterium]|nr:SIS domain-containing protein [Lentisphaeria bacterium]